MTIQLYPTPYDSEKADEIWAKLTEFGLKTEHKALSDAVFGNSPHLAKLANLDSQTAADYICSAFSGDLSAHKTALLDSISQPRPESEKMPDLMRELRQAKAKLSLLTAIADVSKLWSLGEVTAMLTAFADAAVQIALSHALAENMRKGDIPWPDGAPEPVTPSLTRNSGIFVLAMGKHGAHELNYSSDIDLIVLYDPERTTYAGRKSLADCFVKATQTLVQILDKRTMDGYVFRTDLRLRPDPGATPVALNVRAAENYYHSMAVNWERSAMIKARVIAGDTVAGAEFQKIMRSWVWRRTMDFAALRDIAAIKNQINRHYGQHELTFEGFDVKLGHGGIREIEFFAQVNQLLFGGRHAALQTRPTLKALNILVDENLLETSVRDDLEKAYVFLRTLEHRIQMIHDDQTHTIPSEPDALKRLATFMGYDNPDALKQTLYGHCESVKSHYDNLLPEQADETTESLGENKLANTLGDYGFTDCDDVAKIIEGWRRGRYRALRTERAKDLLEAVLPDMLKAFGKMQSPEGTLKRFDNFLSSLPAGVQLFSMLQANPSLFKLLARIMGLAPALADILARMPALWESVLEPDFFAPIEDEETLASYLKADFARARDYQDVLGMVRNFVSDQKFRIGVHLMESIASVEECGAAMTRLADVALQCLIPETSKEFARRHGVFPGGGIAVLAMGKYGGHELTHTSDLDIVFLYHAEDMSTTSNGDKPLPPSQYFSRLGQNIITAITALMPEGRLYEVDTRLRPSGSQGPLVVTLETFSDYYAKSAWTWEHMALTRARIIVAPDAMQAPLSEAIQTVLTGEREGKTLQERAAEMREKLHGQFGTSNIWAIKHTRGGLVDMEFICQYLMLREGNKHPDIFHPDLAVAIKNLERIGALSTSEAETIEGSHRFQQKVQSMVRLCIGSAPESSEAMPGALKDVLVEATGCENFENLETQLAKVQADVYSLFQTIVET